MDSKLENPSAFKEYVIEEITDKGAVFIRTVRIAPLEEYLVSAPSYVEIAKKAVTTKQLRRMLKKNKFMETELFKISQRFGGAMTVGQARSLRIRLTIRYYLMTFINKIQSWVFRKTL